MSLLQELSNAVLSARGESNPQHGSGTNQPEAAAELVPATNHRVPALLDQLAAAVSAIKHGQQHHSSSTGARADRREAGANPVLQVQADLLASNNRLQLLLCQQGRSLPAAAEQLEQDKGPAEAVSAGPATLQAKSTAPSLTALQHLLQLAVGDLSCSTTCTWLSAITPGTRFKAAAGQPLPSPQQQQHWCSAAWEAVHLFSFAELEQLPCHSLQQALLLQPQLLDRFLEAAAAAVLEPVLAAAAGAATVQPGSAAAAAAAARQSHAHTMGAASSAGGSGVGSKAQSMQSLLATACPWMQWLPAMLGCNPLLLLQASSTLLSWFEASGHNRLWQLLSITCRPAWQQLAAATTQQQPSPLPTTTTKRSAGGAVLQERLASAGALQLLCPQAWQRQLVCILAQEPSTCGLMQLLQQLPGISCQSYSHAQQASLPNVTHTSAAAAAEAEDWGIDAALTWPGVDEWCLPVVPADQQQQDVQKWAHQDMDKVKCAWGLLQQHHCWYQYACFLLVHCSLQHLQLQQQQAPQRQSAGLQAQQQRWLEATLQVPQLLQLPSEKLQQQLPRLTAAQLAACAAALIAWVQQPLNATRQTLLRDQLLSGVAAAGSSRQQQPSDAGQVAADLLLAWRTPAPGAAGSCVGCTSPALALRDLPCAVLQQRQLLLDVSPSQLAGLCLQACGAQAAGDASTLRGMPLTPRTQQQADQQQPQDGHSATSSCMEGGVDIPEPTAAVCQLLDISSGVCAAAVEVLNLSMRHQLAGQEEQQHEPAAGHVGLGVASSISWLARQWVHDGACCNTGCSLAAVQANAQQAAAPDLATAKRLLTTAMGVDQHLKQHAQCVFCTDSRLAMA